MIVNLINYNIFIFDKNLLFILKLIFFIQIYDDLLLSNFG